MNQLLKLNAMHKLIMGGFAAEAVIQAGVLYDGWKRGMSVEQSRGIFIHQIKTIKQQGLIVQRNLTSENSKHIAISYESFAKDRNMLGYYIADNKLHKGLFEPAFDYMEFLNKQTLALLSAL